jgi:hypothetical protein
LHFFARKYFNNKKIPRFPIFARGRKQTGNQCFLITTFLRQSVESKRLPLNVVIKSFRLTM